MKLAVVTAPQWAFKYSKGDYHLVSAPWLLEIPGYAQFYAQSIRDKDTWVTLDHGLREGHQMDRKGLARAAFLCRADEIILPDYVLNPKKTLMEAWKAAQALADVSIPTEPMAALSADGTAARVSFRTGPKNMMFVPQAGNLEDWRKCLDAWIDNWNSSGMPDRCALSIGLTCAPNLTALPRKELIRVTSAYPYRVHLLGIADLPTFIRQDLPLASTCAVGGLSTSLPFELGVRGELLSPGSPPCELRAPSHYAIIDHWAQRLIELNIRIMRHWLEEGAASHYFPISLARITASHWTTKDTRPIYENPSVALRKAGCPPGEYEMIDLEVRRLPRGQHPDKSAERVVVTR